MAYWPIKLKPLRRKARATMRLDELNSRVSQLAQSLGSLVHDADTRLGNIDARLARLEDIQAGLSRLDRLLHGAKAVYLGNERILVRATVGDVDLGYFVEANDRLIVPRFIVTGVHEPEVTRYFIETVKPTDHCLDVGANFGYYTCIMACRARAGKTIGIEPDRHVFELLRDNIYINSLEAAATALQAAVGADGGTLTLYRRVTRSGNTAVFRSYDAEELGEPEPVAFEVECIPVDQLLPEFDGRIDCMKVDVEGAEPLVFAGAKEAIASNPHLKIVMEWSPGQILAAGFEPADFVADLRNAGFASSVIRWEGPEPIGWDALLGEEYLSGVLLTRAQQ